MTDQQPLTPEEVRKKCDALIRRGEDLYAENSAPGIDPMARLRQQEHAQVLDDLTSLVLDAERAALDGAGLREAYEVAQKARQLEYERALAAEAELERAELRAIDGCISIVQQSLDSVRGEDDGESRSIRAGIAAREHVIRLLTGYRESRALAAPARRWTSRPAWNRPQPRSRPSGRPSSAPPAPALCRFCGEPIHKSTVTESWFGATGYVSCRAAGPGFHKPSLASLAAGGLNEYAIADYWWQHGYPDALRSGGPAAKYAITKMLADLAVRRCPTGASDRCPGHDAALAAHGEGR